MSGNSGQPCGKTGLYTPCLAVPAGPMEPGGQRWCPDTKTLSTPWRRLPAAGGAEGYEAQVSVPTGHRMGSGMTRRPHVKEGYPGATTTKLRVMGRAVSVVTRVPLDTPGMVVRLERRRHAPALMNGPVRLRDGVPLQNSVAPPITPPSFVARGRGHGTLLWPRPRSPHRSPRPRRSRPAPTQGWTVGVTTCAGASTRARAWTSTDARLSPLPRPVVRHRGL